VDAAVEVHDAAGSAVTANCWMYPFRPLDRLMGVPVIGEGENVMGFVNEANWDRIARVVVGVTLFIVGLAVGGGWGTFLAVVAFVPLLTGLVGWCPLYSLLHIRTNRDRNAGSTT
jgi:hypothetical protein